MTAGCERSTSSDEVSVRPSAAGTPSTSKKLPETTRMGIWAGSPRPVSVMPAGAFAIAATPSRLRTARERSMVSGHEKPRLTVSRLGFTPQIATRRASMLKRQRTQHDAVDDREHRRRGPERSGQTGDRAGEQARRAAQAAERDA